ncbi:pantoate--beta-alanine ligase [Opitutus terrae]|uniref:Pantothenate synthetase n=1 Tax=Opitutus terrae (strain DSM 11246 / JCM 15787 / PB90-1) TaxID=452637 RepID=B1ZVH2_OPITP|nr:pantoate--beta-alanine ligase [Opitutus terrae]ACB74069.1 pantoate--beta-alanine ligase [Opitutus terrae PB90-1]
MPKLIHTIAEWRALRAEHRAAGRTIGFVPTMGALHEGHASLFRAAAGEHPVVLASVFVNPTQFDEQHDFEKYPRTLAADCALMDAAGVTVAFVPSVDEMYPNGTRYGVVETEFSRELCGAHRPGHFAGMLTVVMKLLQIADAEAAYFGEKDYQQLLLIRGMREAFFLPTRIVGCPIIREPDGLAMSSRNARLSSAERALAPQFHSALVAAPTVEQARARLEAAGFRVDYVEDRDGRRFGAVRLGQTRLIDNVSLRVE